MNQPATAAVSCVADTAADALQPSGVAALVASSLHPCRLDAPAGSGLSKWPWGEGE